MSTKHLKKILSILEKENKNDLLFIKRINKCFSLVNKGHTMSIGIEQGKTRLYSEINDIIGIKEF